MSSSAVLIVRTDHNEITVDVPAPRLMRMVSELLRDGDRELNTRCGQRGLCDGCLVELVAGSLVHAVSGETVAAERATGLLQACQYRLAEGGEVTLHVPSRSLLAHRPQIVTSFRIDVSRAHDPLWQVIELRRDELLPDLPLPDAIGRAISGRREADLPVTVALSPGDLASDEQQPLVQLVLEQAGEEWRVLPARGDRPERPFGVAVDIGTTTVVVSLVDLRDGEMVATASALNGQTRLGDNVLTRINLCLTEPGMVRRLQHAVVKRTLRPLLEQVLAEARAEPEQIVTLAMAGNSTMLHLLAGVDPSPMGTAPFTPAFLEHRVLRAGELSLLPSRRGGATARPAPRSRRRIAADPAVHLLPGAAAYVGADIVAGVFSTGMAYRDETCLLVDVGTNGEIVLKHGDQFLGCATAAGPAFEGAGLAYGVRAGSGAISHIRFANEDFEPEIEVIGGESPIGVCGTAYVDFLAQGRQVGLLGSTGRFVDRVAQHARYGCHRHGRSFTVAQGRDGTPLLIAEGDIASLLQAKAAIAAGILCLLNRVGLTSRDVVTLYLAGGFGFHMDIDNVIGCGLLPGFCREQIELVGNSSLAGAYLALLDSGVLAEMKQIGRRMEIVELNLEPDFESTYIDQLSLPDVETAGPPPIRGGNSEQQSA